MCLCEIAHQMFVAMDIVEYFVANVTLWIS